ncbi:MAG: hypothetical protein IJ455_03195 [Agathobacter sp.]|nr:hypothetical protein [Agathobacter sp.]
MKEYKLVTLNEEMRLSLAKDIQDAEETLNEYIQNGWELQQITPYHSGYLVAVMYKEV